MTTEHAGQWTLTITCPRPKNRAIDDFHVRPEKVAKMAAEWFGPDAELTLTARTVRLTHTSPLPISNTTEWNERLATAHAALNDARTAAAALNAALQRAHNATSPLTYED